MTSKINEKQKFNPAEELEATTLSPELQPLNEIATEIAGTKKETGKKLTHHKTQVQYKLLASNEVMVVEENSEFFNSSGINDLNKKAFQKLTPSEKEFVLNYYNKGLENNPTIEAKEKKFLANNLIEYAQSLRNTRLFIEDYINGNQNPNFKGGVSLKMVGEKIDKYSKLKTGLSDKGYEIDKKILEIMNNIIKQTDERIKQTDERIKQTDERIKQTDEIIKILDKLINSI